MGQWRVIGEARRIGPKAGGAGREGATWTNPFTAIS